MDAHYARGSEAHPLGSRKHPPDSDIDRFPSGNLLGVSLEHPARGGGQNSVGASGDVDGLGRLVALLDGVAAAVLPE